MLFKLVAFDRNTKCTQNNCLTKTVILQEKRSAANIGRCFYNRNKYFVCADVKE